MAQHIKTFLTPFIQQKDQWKITLLHNWEVCMGSLAKRVSIEKIYDETIVLNVPDSCWLQEMYLLSPTILRTINQSLDVPRIKEIRFKQAGRSGAAVQTGVGAIQHHRERHAPPRITLSHAERETLKTISDPELRTALEAFLMRCYREKKR